MTKCASGRRVGALEPESLRAQFHSFAADGDARYALGWASVADSHRGDVWRAGARGNVITTVPKHAACLWHGLAALYGARARKVRVRPGAARRMCTLNY